jgi:hypothetical protein
MESKVTLKDLILYTGFLFSAVALYLTIRREEAWTAVGMFVLWVGSVACVAWAIHQERKLRREAEADATKSYNKRYELELALKAEKKKAEEAANGWSQQVGHWQKCYRDADKNVHDQRIDLDNLRGELNDANRTITGLTEQLKTNQSDAAEGVA